MKIDTLAVHAAREPDPTTRAIAAPLVMSTTFERAADGTYPQTHYYGRSGNPNREQLELGCPKEGAVFRQKILRFQASPCLRAGPLFLGAQSHLRLEDLSSTGW